jgi:hypothetical protein
VKPSVARKAEAPPQPEPLPVVLVVAMATSSDGLHAALLLHTQASRVVRRELLCVSRSLEKCEAAWQAAAYARLHRGREEWTPAEAAAIARDVRGAKAESFAECMGLALVRSGKQTACVYVEVEGDRLVAQRVVSMGRRLDALLALDAEAGKSVLRAQRDARTRRNEGWWRT